MKFKAFSAALMLVCIGTSAYSENLKLLLSPAISDSNSIKGLRFWLIDQSLREASVSDRYEKDPFGRGEEYDVYKHTSVSCNLNLFLKNDTGVDVAFRDPFATVIGLKFVGPDKTMTMQGNIGMSTMFRGLSEDNDKILKNGDYVGIEFVSMSSVRFDSASAAKTAVSDGICDFKNIERVDPAGIMGEIMLSNENQWRAFSNSFYVLESFQ